MQVELKELRLSIFVEDLTAAAAAALGVAPAGIAQVRILRRSLDARSHRDPQFTYHLLVTLAAGVRPAASSAGRPLSQPPPRPLLTTASIAGAAPVVIGAGPAGLFAALAFAEAGLPALLVDRGRPVAERAADVAAFWREGCLDPESNMYFGEGGAGTFSDGKLTTRTSHPWAAFVLEELIRAGAPAEIAYDSRAHIGTDNLLRLLPRLRQRLQDLGTRFAFQTKFEGLRPLPDGGIELILNGAPMRAAPLVLACGHSAFDTYRMLQAQGIAMAVKGFALGCRIEHPADFVTSCFYGKNARVRQRLGHAAYTLSAKVDGGRASTYSFCCCPGGEVVACSALPGHVSVNGMSNRSRNSAWTNAGLVSSFSAEEAGADVADALARREALEAACFTLAGGHFQLPAQRPADFLRGHSSASLPATSARRPLIGAELGELLPPLATARLREGLRRFEERVPGWITNGLLIGVETTTSSPVRILRNDQRESLSCPGLLPVGEGSGYAGGIMTSALDGFQAALDWINNRR